MIASQGTVKIEFCDVPLGNCVANHLLKINNDVPKLPNYLIFNF